MTPIEMLNNDTNMQNRFWRKVNKSSDCWNWTGHITLRGYGQIKTKRYDRKRYSIVASRYSLFLKTGILDSGLFACHTCDNTKCVNPNHLFWGTPQDNQIDCILKNRREVRYKDYDDARKIREEISKGKTYEEIASIGKKYGISPSISRAIKYGTKWAYIPHKE